jgi:DNA modification methylase
MARIDTIDDLVAAEYNPRKISKDAATALGKSMSRFGDIAGIVFNTRTGRLVSGHQRVAQLKALGAQLFRDGDAVELRVGRDGKRFSVRTVDWDDATEKAANITANNPHIGGEFTDSLQSLLDEVKLSIGDDDFAALRLDELMSPAVPDTHEDDAPEVDESQEPRTKPGDLWVLGEHRLLCGDSASDGIIARVLGGERAGMVFTDPPYGVEIAAKNRMLREFYPAERNTTDIIDDAMSADDLRERLLPAFIAIRKHMADDCTVFVTAPDNGGLSMMIMVMMRDAGLPVRHVLIWKKNQPTFSMGRLDYDYQHESILLTWGKRHKRPMLGKHRTSVWEIDRPRASAEHPTMKPVELVANAMLNNSDEGDTVLDTYCGSGTTIVAAEQMKRRGRGVEIEPRYCDVIVTRWETLTGRKAVLT